MSDFLAPGGVDTFERTSRALDEINKSRAAAGKPLLTEYLLEERNRWLHAYQYAADPAERERAAEKLRRQDMTLRDAERVGSGCPPEIREKIARLVDRTRQSRRGGDAERVGDILAGKPGAKGRA